MRRRSSRVVDAAAEFAATHDDKDRKFLLAAGSAGIEAATNIVVEQANRTMLLYVYARGDRAVLHHLPQLARGAWWRWCRSSLTSILCEALMVVLGIGVKVATLPVIALGVGIGVDYALYLLSRAARAAARRRAAGRGVQEGACSSPARWWRWSASRWPPA